MNAGLRTLVATFTPTDSAEYADSTATVTIDVLRATTMVYWASPGTIVHGTPLGATQLDAVASVSGVFTFTAGTGTVLPTGNGQTLAAVFTPSDSTDFTMAYISTSINVQPSPPPGLTVQTHSFSGRVRKTLGGVIAQLHTTMSKLRPTYYSALVNWDDGVIQNGKLVRSGTRGFKPNASHRYQVAGAYQVSVTISDPQGDSVTETLAVSVH